jgi:tetratricopeptide (TPR) repeat protein
LDLKTARSTGAAVMAIVLLAGVAALSYARWTRPIADADAALAAGRLDEALAQYAEAEARFDRYEAARQLFATEYSRVVGNQILVLYRLGRYDETIDKAARAPEAARPHFWAGSAFFQKGRAEAKPDMRLAWFSRAEEELRRALEASPADWDAKFDFELVTRLAAELRKEPTVPPNQLMQLLRPQPKPGAKPVKRVG